MKRLGWTGVVQDQQLAKRTSTGHRTDIERFVRSRRDDKNEPLYHPRKSLSAGMHFLWKCFLRRSAASSVFLRTRDFIYRDSPDDPSAFNQLSPSFERAQLESPSYHFCTTLFRCPFFCSQFVTRILIFPRVYRSRLFAIRTQFLVFLSQIWYFEDCRSSMGLKG